MQLVASHVNQFFFNKEEDFNSSAFGIVGLTLTLLHQFTATMMPLKSEDKDKTGITE